ncbi:fibronectin type III domain-containing protein [Fulvivirga maritima]|uniref:fibronectin type III domain-containing protein n=1 Tax=Fulvivirga maritima TaxID=2904247 RepID=UPI001F3AD51D|nr:fibronectin type III domain-containing protein [Fulvivirga maritima]UII27541.1 fibronectin type III domain-containing protein [Fulvivirga maritima]
MQAYLVACLPGAQAQTFPVSAQLQLTPPYSVYLSDLLRPETDQVKLNLILRDLQEPFVDVVLKLKIEGQGLSMETAPYYMPPALTLESGTPQLLTTVELSPYFDAANLIFGGISKSKYEQQGGRLPEGLYRISFTAYDANTGRQLSMPAQAIAWMALSEPPRLNQPFCESEINLESGMQYIVFQWSPIGVSPNTFGELEYEFSLVEIRPEGRDPYEAMRTTAPVYQYTTSETSLVYDNDEPLLLPGMTYAWRVHAKDVGGKEKFRNEGFSSVCTFRIAEQSLPVATGVRAEAVTSYQGRTYWDLVDGVDNYRIEYRSTEGGSGQWYSIDEPEEAGGAIDGQVNLTGLTPGHGYEVRVGSKREELVSSWSESVFFSTPDEEVLACGDMPTVESDDDFIPLINAGVGDVIQAANVDVTLVSVTGNGQDGVYSGWGTISINFLGNRIPVEFSDIKINDRYRMVSGELVAISTGMDEYIQQWREVREDEEVGDSEAEDNASSEEAESESSDTEVGGNAPTDSTSLEEAVIPMDSLITEADNVNSSDSTLTDYNNNDDYNESDSTGGNNVIDPNAPNDSNNEGNGNGSGVTPSIWFALDDNEYHDGDVITIPFTSLDNHLAFTLRDYPNNVETFNWSFLQDGVDHTVEVLNNDRNLDNFGMNIGGRFGDLRLRVQYDEDVIEVILNVERKEFSLEEIYAKDGDRVAKSQEILYLVAGDDERQIIFDSDINPGDIKNGDYVNLDMVWSYIEQLTPQHNLEQVFGEKKIVRKLYEEDNIISTEFRSGYPNRVEKKVEISWVDEDLKKIDVASKLGPILSIFDEINYWSKTFKAVGIPCKVAVLDNLPRAIGRNEFGLSYETFNEEEDETRYYRNIDKFVFSATGANIVDLTCGKDITIPIPFSSSEITLAAANFGVKAGLKGEVELVREVQVETGKTFYNKSKVTAAAFVSPFVEATLAGIVGKIDMDTGVRIEYPYDGNPALIGFIWYSSDISGKVEVGKDFSQYLSKSITYELFRLNTKKEIEIYKLDFNSLTK